MRARRVAALVAAALIVSCAPTSSHHLRETNATNVFAVDVSLPDGRVVMCVVYGDTFRGGGVSCDWEGKR